MQNIIDNAGREWEPSGDDLEALLYVGKFDIFGVPCHVEAHRVHTNEDGMMEGSDTYDRLFDAVGADGGFYTLDIGGSQYAVFASPYCL